MRIRYPSVLAFVAALALASPAAALPVINGVSINTRIFNDCPGSILATNNNYPASITISDQNVGCIGFANLHTWSYSTDLVNPAEFANSDHFQHSATLTITGTGQGEAGLRISPWWSPHVDGRFNVRTTDGEIAVFGGRLPFFSFTGAFGLNYAKGNPIRLDMIYWPNGNSAALPASIQYRLNYLGNDYASPLIHFDMGNPGEDPPHGLWGILNPAYVGGYVQFLVGQSGATGDLTAQWDGVTITQTPTNAKPSSWGRIKSLYK
jgi:hypothetical protein